MADQLPPPPGPRIRLLARAADWSVAEHVCEASPADPVFEEAHDGVTIAAVVGGVFTYRTGTGKALLHPGALLLGNDGQCFECGHDHGTGDRCISIQFSPALFAEVAASVAGTSGYRFTVPMLLPLPPLAAATTALDAFAAGAPCAGEEAIIALAERVIATASGQSPIRQSLSAHDERRLAAVLRHVEAHHDDALDLAALADVAGMSKYHFLRAFRRATGVTPYQFLLALRMHKAAVDVAATTEPISTIAFARGFGDLSTFNHRFRLLYRSNPSAFRRRSSQRRDGRVIT